MTSLTSPDSTVLVTGCHVSERHGSHVTWPDTGSQLSSEECDRAPPPGPGTQQTSGGDSEGNS